MPVIERPKKVSYWLVACDECKTERVPGVSYSDATKAAYDSGWICFGKVWICGICRWKGEQAVELKPTPVYQEVT